MKDIYYAEDINKARIAIKAFEVNYGAKHPKAVARSSTMPMCSWSSLIAISFQLVEGMSLRLGAFGDSIEVFVTTVTGVQTVQK